MTKQKRVLIVEDHPDLLENYKKNVTRAGFLVETASTKDEAFEKLRRRTYHVAMVDVNLTDYSGGDGSRDRSGIDVVRKINAQAEGTRCVVISGEKSSEVPVDAHDAGINKYIIKKRIRVPADYVEPVKELVKATEIRSIGRFGDLIAYLSFPDKRWSWESNLMQMLGCDAPTLSRTLEATFGDFLPALRQANASFSFVRSADSKQITGEFWSKAAGFPIWVAIGRKGAKLVGPPGKNSDPIHARAKGDVQFCVWRTDTLKRDDFIDSPDELR